MLILLDVQKSLWLDLRFRPSSLLALHDYTPSQAAVRSGSMVTWFVEEGDYGNARARQNFNIKRDSGCHANYVSENTFGI